MRNAVLVTLLFVFLAPAVAAPPADQGLNLEQYAGKVVVVDFWASWCVPCRRSFPWLNTMQARYADRDLVIIGVNVDRQRTAADAFLAEYPATFQIHYDSDAQLAESFGVEGMPSSFVIGRDGEILARHLGFKVKKQDEYEAVLIDALGEKQ